MNINGKQQVPAPKTTEAVEKVQYTGLTKLFPICINPTIEELTSKLGYKEPKEPYAYLGTNNDGATQMRWEIHCKRMLGNNIKDTFYVSDVKVGKDGKYKFITDKGLVTGAMFANLAEAKSWASKYPTFGTPVREVFEGEEQLYQFLSVLIPMEAQKTEGFSMLLSNLPYTEKAVKELNKALTEAGLFITKDETPTQENFGVCTVIGLKITDKGVYEEIVKPKYSNPYFKFPKLNKNITSDVIGQALTHEDKYDKETKSSPRQSYIASVFNPNTDEKYSNRQTLQVCAIHDTAKYNDKYKVQSLTLEYKVYDHNTFTPTNTNVTDGNSSVSDGDLPF